VAQNGAPADVAACPAKGELIGFSSPLPDPNFQLFYSVLAADAKRAGLTTFMTSANLDPAKQNADIATLLAKGARAIIIAPVDPNAIQPAVKRAAAKGVPVIVTDTKIGGPYATNLQTRAREGAAQAADYLKQKVGTRPVAAILGPTFAEAVRVRNEGFLAEAKKDGLTIVDTKTNTPITPDEARRITTDWRARYGSTLAGSFTFNDTSAIGASSVPGGSFRPLIVSMNAQPDAVALVQQRRITATYDLHPFTLGHGFAWAADQARCGKKLPATLNIDASVVDSATVGSWVPWTEQRQKRATIVLTTRGSDTFIDAR